MNNSLINKLLRTGVIAALVFGAASAAQAEPFIDFGVSTGFFVRGCDINAPGGPDCLPGGNFPPFEATENVLVPLGDFATVNTSTVRGNAGASIGFQGVSLTPAISVFVNSSATGRISSGGDGIQQYTAQQDGTVVLNGTLTFSISGGVQSPVNPQPTDDLSWGAIFGGILVLESETDRLDLADYGRFVNGELIGGLTDTEQWDGVTEVASAFFDVPAGQSFGPVTASLSLDVQAGDVFFVLTFVRVLARYGGFANSTGTLIAEFDQPAAVAPTATEESFVPVEFQTVPGIDIRPKNAKNKIRPRSKNAVRVAIITTNTADGEPVDLDATQIDPRSIRIGPNEARVIRHHEKIKDVDKDGDPDLVVWFKPRKTGVQCGDTELTLTANTYAGAFFRGTDIIKTVGCKNRH
jgi:hypothetical protein